LKFNTKKAIKAQREILKRAKFKPVGKVRLIAGCDLSFFNPFKTPTIGIAGFVVMDINNLEVVETSYATCEVKVPYIPGFLGFREIIVLNKVFLKLKNKPDVVMIDGHGLAHPRKTGIALHFGVIHKIPTIGCAKNLLYGKVINPEKNVSEITSPEGEVIGFSVRRGRFKPVFVSPGNLITLEDCLKLTMLTFKNHRLPEPTYLAHQLVTKVRKQLLHSKDNKRSNCND